MGDALPLMIREEVRMIFSTIMNSKACIFILALLIGVSGCKASNPEYSFQNLTPVQAPLTVHDAKILHHPPEVVVKVTRKKKSETEKELAGPCGHTPLCILAIIPSVYDSLEHIDMVEVEKKGKIAFLGTYEPSGDLLSAKVYTKGIIYEIAPFVIPALGKKYIIETGRFALDGGRSLEFPSFKAQVDLLGEYRKAILKTKDDVKRADLLMEAKSILGKEEAKEFLREKLLDPVEFSEFKRRYAMQCGTVGISVEEIDLVARLSPPNAETAEYALRCFINDKSSDPVRAAPFAKRVIAEICDSERGFQKDVDLQILVKRFSKSTRCQESEKFGGESQACEQLTPSVKAEIDACALVDRRVLLKALFDLPVSESEKEQALQVESPLQNYLVYFLQGKKLGLFD